MPAVDANSYGSAAGVAVAEVAGVVVEKPHSDAEQPSPQSPQPAPSREAIALRHAIGYLRDLSAADATQSAESVRRGVVGSYHCHRCGWNWEGVGRYASGARRRRKEPLQCARCRSRSWQVPLGRKESIAQRWLDEDARAEARWLARRAQSLRRIASAVAREARDCGIDGLLALLRPEVAAYLRIEASAAQRADDAARIAAIAVPVTQEMVEAERRATTAVAAPMRAADDADDDAEDDEEVEVASAADDGSVKIDKHGKVDWGGLRFAPIDAPPPIPRDEVFVNTPSRPDTIARLALGGPVLAPAPPRLDDLRERDLPPLVTTPPDEGER